ncbi:AprI/Inh family metalloprotease inhibitor [Pseudomonas vranovensis]|uniref:AprI/Inh family metalloprotease inhibitor n=1 Tax=Pseudomonas vranovensis TaxID=321661 RepID=UPI003D96CADB
MRRSFRGGQIMALKRMIALGAIPLMLMTEVGMASSLLLPTPAQLAGDWTLYPENDRAAGCELQLDAAQTLHGDLQCAEGLIGQRPSGWLPTPDTLALLDGSGSALVHFNRFKPGIFKWISPSKKILFLERKNKE